MSDAENIQAFVDAQNKRRDYLDFLVKKFTLQADTLEKKADVLYEETLELEHKQQLHATYKKILESDS